MTKQTQITKPAAAKPVNAIAAMVQSAPVAAKIVKADAEVKKVARTKRAAQKPVAKVESIVAKSAKVIAVKYQISTAARPAAGRQLKAYTEAVLQLLGMYKGKAYDRATLNTIMGSTAVNYHTTRTLAITATNDGLMLTPGFGSDFFAMRAELNEFDPKDVEDYKAILTTGKADNRLVKNQAFLKAI